MLARPPGPGSLLPAFADVRVDALRFLAGERGLAAVARAATFAAFLVALAGAFTTVTSLADLSSRKPR